MLLIWNLYGGALSGVKQIVPAELTRLINHENAIVVDVRPATDYENNHILNALNIPDAELESRKTELDKYLKRPVIFYCGSGAISARMARIFSKQGFEQVFCLKGGLPSWTGANLPLSKET